MQTDFPKDVAAMANSGGGTIDYGVEESQKSATGRCDVGELSEGHERTLRSAAVTAITPPVFGLDIAVAHPRIPTGGQGRLPREDARKNVRLIGLPSGDAT